MQDLIKRLQEAKKGKRAFDGQITVAVRAMKTSRGTTLPDWVDRNYPDWHSAEDGTVFATKNGFNWQPLHYTTSIDDALTLVPKGWDWVVGRTETRLFPPDWEPDDLEREVRVVSVSLFDESDVYRTPVLALCIAALKARHSIDIAFESSTM